MLEKDLQKIGLSEKEAKVYLASLELGESVVQDIANKANVNRATTYVILEQLQKKGVISEIERGKKRFFVASGPYALKQVIRDQADEIEQKRQKLDKLFPKIKKVHDKLPNRAVVRYYEGKEAVQSIREQFLDVKSKQLHAFFSEEEVINIFDEEDREHFSRRRQEAGIQFTAVYNSVGDSMHSKSSPRPHTDTRPVPKDQYYFPCDITVFDDKVSITILSGQPAGIVIESESIAETFRSVFKLAYEAAEEFSKK